MTEAFKTRLPSVQKFVFVALCDNANDQGQCFPSVTMLAEKCSLSVRAVRDSLRALESGGFVVREYRHGRSTTYAIANPGTWRTPAPPAAPPRQDVPTTPAPPAAPPRQDVPTTPAPPAGITIIEPSVEPSVNQKNRRSPAQKVEWVTPAMMLETLPGLTEPVAIGYLEFRRSKKAALTAYAWKSIVSEVIKSGMAPDTALPYAMNRGWQGFDASWLKPAGQATGKPSKHDLSTMDYSKGVTPDGRF